MLATAELLKNLSPQDFLALGAHQLAYIRPIIVNGTTAFSIHAADGTQLAIHDDVIAAQALTRQNDLEPMTLH